MVVVLLELVAPLELVPPIAPLELVAGAVVLRLLWWAAALWVLCRGAPLEVHPFVLGGIGNHEVWSAVC